MKLSDFKNFLFGTLRGRLILGVAIVHAVMMTIFIFDLTFRQRKILLERQIEEVTALAKSLSTSSAVWIASDDVAGLQELVSSIEQYPELEFAMLTDERGYVLAHTDHDRIGQYVLDLPVQTSNTELIKTPALLEVFVPAHLGNQYIGWVRVGINRSVTSDKLTNVISTGVLYALVAIIIGSVIAWWMGLWFTHRLYAVQNTIRDVRKGNPRARSKIEGTDEAASIAKEFNVLLDTLDTQHSLLLALINSSTDFVIFSLDTNYCYTAFNEKHRTEMKNVWNVDVEVGMNLLDCMHITQLKQLAKQSMDRVLQGESFSEVQHQSELNIFYELSWNPIFQNNEVVGITAFIRNITTQKQNEAQIIKLNRIYAVLSNINQAIVRIHEPQEMMKEACRIAVEHGKFKLAWIGMANTETNKVDITASFGETGDYLNNINIDLSDPERNSGPTGTAVITGVHKISNNILLDDSMMLWRRDALNYGYKSSASFPLIVNEKVVGAFNLYSDEPGFFQEDDIKLLDEMAIDISFALEFIDAEKEREKVERELLRSEKELKRAQEITHIGSWYLDVSTNQVIWSEELYKMYGFDPTLPPPPYTEHMKLFTSESWELLSTSLARTRETGIPYELELKTVRENGSNGWMWVRGETIQDTEGKIMGLWGAVQDITERKQAEEALKNTAQRLNEAQRLAHIGSWELDLINNVLIWTDEIYRIFEIDPEKFGATYDAFLGAIHPDDKDNVNFAYTNSLKTKTPYAIDHRLLFPDGRVKYVHEQCETFYDGDNPIRSIGTVQDITESSLAEEALKESEWRYREIFDNVLDGLYLLEVTDDGHFRTIEVNPALERITGIPRSFSVGKTQEETVPVEVAAIVNEKYRHCVETGHPVEEEVQLDLPAGNRYFHSILIPARDKSGQIHRIVGISRDITEQKEAEQKLKLLNFSLNNVYDEAYLINEKSGFDYVNDECCRASGYSSEELLKMNVSDIDPDFPFNKWQDHWKFIMEHGSMVFEGRHKTKGGEIYPVEISANYFEYNGTGYNLAMCRNISERKQAEAEIQKLNQELERRVIERTSQLEAANKELEAFSYSVSHDLRAPLRSIDGFSHILLDDYQDKVDEQGKNYLQRVRSATQRMAQLIDDMLNLSRVSRFEMKIQEVNLSEIFLEITRELHETQPERKVEFIIQEGIKVRGDSHLLRIVLENLIGNAWKFTSKHPTARIEFGELQENNQPIYFVRDNGAGFDMNYSKKLFGAFQRLHTTIEFPGTGIGLATIQRIIRRHGGEVWAEGEIEKGATFYFTLPVNILSNIK